MATVRVRLLQRMAGPRGNWGPGKVVAVAADEAVGLVDGGFAVYADPPPSQPVAEMAAVEPPERAVKPPARRKSTRRKKVGGGTTK